MGDTDIATVLAEARGVAGWNAGELHTLLLVYGSQLPAEVVRSLTKMQASLAAVADRPVSELYDPCGEVIRELPGTTNVQTCMQQRGHDGPHDGPIDTDDDFAADPHYDRAAAWAAGDDWGPGSEREDNQ